MSNAADARTDPLGGGRDPADLEAPRNAARRLRRAAPMTRRPRHRSTPPWPLPAQGRGSPRRSPSDAGGAGRHQCDQPADHRRGRDDEQQARRVAPCCTPSFSPVRDSRRRYSRTAWPRHRRRPQSAPASSTASAVMLPSPRERGQPPDCPAPPRAAPPPRCRPARSAPRGRRSCSASRHEAVHAEPVVAPGRPRTSRARPAGSCSGSASRSPSR